MSTLRCVAAGLWALGALLGPALAGAQTLRSVQMPTDLSLGMGIDDKDLTQMIIEAEPRLEFDIGDASSLVVSARLRLDYKEALEPGTPELDSYSAASKPATLGSLGTVDLRDVYFEQRLSRGILRLGKQQIVWGRLDGIKVLDVLNPQSFREFILDDFGDSRISQWSAYLDVLAGAWRVEAALIPDYSGHEIPRPGAWFELRAPRFRYGVAWSLEGRDAITEDRRDPIDDAAVALRVSRSFGRIDVSGMAYSGNDHEPLGRLVERNQVPLVQRFYERRELLGISLESALGSVALRAEASYQPDRVFNTRLDAGLGVIEADQFQLGVAADVDGPFGLFMNLQFLWDEVLDAPQDLVRPERDRVATVFVRRSFAYETARLEARWYHSFDDEDDLFSARLEYDLGDETTVYLSSDWFSGTREGLFGQFRERDRVVFGVQHTF